MRNWIDDLARAQAQGQRAISIAVASTRGSVPREAGTRMLVTENHVAGTIGGGHLEFRAIQISRELLASEGAAMIMRFPLGASLGQCCGGLVNLLFEPVASDAEWVQKLDQIRRQARSCIVVTKTHGAVSAGKLIIAADECIGTLGTVALDSEAIAIARHRMKASQLSTLVTMQSEEYFFETIAAEEFHVSLFGAGHVGRALVKILSDLPCNITWIDSRDAEFPADVPRGVRKVVSEFPEDEVACACAGSVFLVMTHSHQLDQAICEQVLTRDDFTYFGMIGSLSKRRQFERRLLARGIPASRLARMTCPVGADGIASKEPMAIAISVAAELLRHVGARSAVTTATIAQGGPSRPLPPENVRFGGR